ncbi:MAG: hypothetical protein AB7G28_26410 [Pirellulales bacterium]
MLAFDANKDGKLTKDEVTDGRLHRLFDRTDSDKDGTVTSAELTAESEKMEPSEDNGADFGPGGFGPPPGDFGPPDDFGPGGPPRRGGMRGAGFGPGGPFGRPAPGQVLDGPIRERLGLNEEQIRELDDLQKDVDARLAKILTDEQRDELRQMSERGPRGRGGPTGPGRDRDPNGPRRRPPFDGER